MYMWVSLLWLYISVFSIVIVYVSVSIVIVYVSVSTVIVYQWVSPGFLRITYSWRSSPDLVHVEMGTQTTLQRMKIYFLSRVKLHQDKLSGNDLNDNLPCFLIYYSLPALLPSFLHLVVYPTNFIVCYCSVL